jgi:hypothetical protein
MSTHTSRIAAFLVLVALALSVPGCTVYERTYPGRSADQVWTAMIAVAEQPSYDSEEWGKWHVMSNDVWVDEPQARIEVYRKLRRVVYNAGMVRPDEQDRTYRMTVKLRDAGTPRIHFETRAIELPTDGFTESQRYFDDVGALLEGVPELAEPTVTVAPAEEPAAEGDVEAPGAD